MLLWFWGANHKRAYFDGIRKHLSSYVKVNLHPAVLKIIIEGTRSKGKIESICLAGSWYIS